MIRPLKTQSKNSIDDTGSNSSTNSKSKTARGSIPDFPSDATKFLLLFLRGRRRSCRWGRCRGICACSRIRACSRVWARWGVWAIYGSSLRGSGRGWRRVYCTRRATGCRMVVLRLLRGVSSLIGLIGDIAGRRGRCSHCCGTNLLNVVTREQAFSAIQLSGPPVSIGLIDDFNNISLAERKLIGVSASVVPHSLCLRTLGWRWSRWRDGSPQSRNIHARRSLRRGDAGRRKSGLRGGRHPRRRCWLLNGSSNEQAANLARCVVGEDTLGLKESHVCLDSG